tara:strand:- start:1826 stop:3322 length:1497 start_codon:yes stop_codon:yes gene_type:complete
MSIFKYQHKVELIIFTAFSFLLALYLVENFMPAEDASILFRYSENLADTGIISYNINGNPTEGATDFLWMILLSVLYFFGLNTYFASILINLLSLYLILNIIREHYSLSKIETYGLFLLHFSISHTYAALGGFSVLFVELFLVLIVVNFIKKNVFNTLLFSFIGCLIRPDFILFIIIPNIINLLENFNFKHIRYFILFLLLGLIYFYSRYIYFDLFLPLPFYIKNQWSFLNNLEWGRQIIILSPAFLILFFTNFRKVFKKTVLTIMSIAAFATAYYTNQILYQNIGYRFYFYFPVLLIFIIYEIQIDMNNGKKVAKNIILIISCLSIIINFSQKFNSFSFVSKKADIYTFAKELNNIDKGVRLSLATTEAGLLPYYSKINTVDLFGLNTKEFAKKPADGFILLKNNFDIIVINSSMTGNSCNSLKEVLDESKNLNVKGANRSDNWIEFVFKLLYGIDIAKYDSYLFSYPKNIFINKNSDAYEKISNSLKKTKASKCNF